MKSHEIIAVELKSVRNQIAYGSVECLHWDKKERTMRALKALGACWGIAIVSVILPIVHFVLVPGFFIAGPVAYFLISSQEEVILGGKGECPECHKEVEIVRSKVEWPLTDLCNHCRIQLLISRT